MKPQSLPVAKLFQNGGDIHYVLPVFQREYTWERQQWQTLLEDAIGLHNEIGVTGKDVSDLEHFLGSVVVINDGTRNGTVPAFQVVDGQQRLTTISLLLHALQQCLGKEHAALAKKIRRLLVNADEDGEVHFKLLPTAKFTDRDSYLALVSGEGIPSSQSRIPAAYEFFRKELSQRLQAASAAALDPERLFLILTQTFQVVFIDLNRDENPYQIFESLNGKGKPLSQADLVRNYIAMRLSPKAQDKVFHGHWAIVEDKLRDQRIVGRSRLGELTAFLRHYMAMRSGVLCSEEHVYARFRDRARELFPTEEEFADEIVTLRRFAELYDRLLRPESETSAAARTALQRLNTLEASTTFPFLLAAYDAYESHKIPEAQWLGILATLENYLVRRYLADEATSFLNRLFQNLWVQVNDEAEKQGTDLVTALRGYLAIRNYPNAARLRLRLTNRSLYDTSSLTRQRTALVLETINRHLSKGTGGYTVLGAAPTIEHILPQDPNEDWKEALRQDIERIKREYLHTLGNLTLVTQDWNSSLSNKSFTIKKQRLAVHALRINSDFFTQNIAEWDEQAIRARCEWLVGKVLEVWPSLGDDGDVGSAHTPPSSAASSAPAASFNGECVARIASHLGTPLLRKSGTTFASVDGAFRITCAVSKQYLRGGGLPSYWYAFHRSQMAYLEAASGQAYVSFGCGSADKVVLFPFSEFEPFTARMNQTVEDKRDYSHVVLQDAGAQFFLVLQRSERVDVTSYLLKDGTLK